MEHLTRFGLAREPFRNEPQPEFWFESASAGDARARLLRCLQQGKELSVLCGEVGSGTTSLARRLLDALDPDAVEIGMLVVGRGVEPAWLRGALARQLGIAEPAASRAEAMRQLYERLVEIRDEGRRAVVAIDEAQALAGSEALGELVALLNFECDDAFLLSILLVGSPELERMLAREPALLGRCDLRVRLEPLGAEEARAYLAHRLRVAGGDAALLTPDVADAIAERAGGLPRRVNALADNAFFEAHLARRERPTVVDVERAARDLPWSQSSAETVSGVAPGALGLGAAEEGKPDTAPDFPHEEGDPLDQQTRAAASAALAALEVPDLDLDAGTALDGEIESAAEATPPPARSRYDLDLTMREEELDAEVLSTSGPDHTAPGAWARAQPASSEPASGKGSPPVPDEEEIDGLFVDLVDGEAPARRS